LWDMSGPKPRDKVVLGDLGQVTALAFAMDSQTVAVGTPGGVILWEVANPKKPKKSRSWRLPGAVNSVTFAQDGRHLIPAPYLLCFLASREDDPDQLRPCPPWGHPPFWLDSPQAGHDLERHT
jgi:hypothetical protein